MQFEEIINAKLSKDVDRPMMKKEPFPVSEGLVAYLKKYGRDIILPIAYRDLLNYRYATSIRDRRGKLTHWETAVYDLKEMEFLKEGLVKTYAILKTEGNLNYIKRLDIIMIVISIDGVNDPDPEGNTISKLTKIYSFNVQVFDVI